MELKSGGGLTGLAKSPGPGRFFAGGGPRILTRDDEMSEGRRSAFARAPRDGSIGASQARSMDVLLWREKERSKRAVPPFRRRCFHEAFPLRQDAAATGKTLRGERWKADAEDAARSESLKVEGRRSEVGGRRSEVGRSKVEGRRSKVGGRRSEEEEEESPRRFANHRLLARV